MTVLIWAAEVELSWLLGQNVSWSEMNCSFISGREHYQWCRYTLTEKCFHYCSQAVQSQFSLVARSIIKLCTNLKKFFTPRDPEVMTLSVSREHQEVVLSQDVESHLQAELVLLDANTAFCTDSLDPGCNEMYLKVPENNHWIIIWFIFYFNIIIILITSLH